MPRFLMPGTYVAEVAGVPPITSVPTATAAFIGPAASGDPAGAPPLLCAYADYGRRYAPAGNAASIDYLACAARAFFAEGGKRLFVLRVAGADPAAWDAAFASVAMLDEVAIVAAPGASALAEPLASLVAAKLVAFAEGAGAFALVDPPPGLDIAAIRALRQRTDSANAALYYPWLKIAAAGGAPVAVPPSGTIAGLFARNDIERGVAKAPADLTITGAIGLERLLTGGEQDVLAPLGINCLRLLPGRGIRAWGARTTSSDPERRYVGTSRYLLYLRRSLQRGLGWAAFEPDGAGLRTRVVAAVNDFLQGEWRGGALQGATPAQAYFAKCDRTTMSEADIAEGRLVLLVGVATIKPAEFVIFRTMLATAGAT